jgi:hypothetical protein
LPTLLPTFYLPESPLPANSSNYRLRLRRARSAQDSIDGCLEREHDAESVSFEKQRIILM